MVGPMSDCRRSRVAAPRSGASNARHVVPARGDRGWTEPLGLDLLDRLRLRAQRAGAGQLTAAASGTDVRGDAVGTAAAVLAAADPTRSAGSSGGPVPELLRRCVVIEELTQVLPQAAATLVDALVALSPTTVPGTGQDHWIAERVVGAGGLALPRATAGAIGAHLQRVTLGFLAGAPVGTGTATVSTASLGTTIALVGLRHRGDDALALVELTPAQDSHGKLGGRHLLTVELDRTALDPRSLITGRWATDRLAAVSVNRRLGDAAAAVGVGQAAHDTMTRALRRTGPGTAPLARSWTARLAQHAVQLEAARALYYKAVLLHAGGRAGATASAEAAVVAASRVAHDTARDAVRLLSNPTLAVSAPDDLLTAGTLLDLAVEDHSSATRSIARRLTA